MPKSSHDKPITTAVVAAITLEHFIGTYCPATTANATVTPGVPTDCIDKLPDVPTISPLAVIVVVSVESFGVIVVTLDGTAKVASVAALVFSKPKVVSVAALVFSKPRVVSVATLPFSKPKVVQ